MGKIHILDKSVSNMIAAGEVVERPLSIVKELVENSIDAGATTITITIADGGASLIRVADNGTGMSEEDAKVCFLRHATSKIRTSEDLDAIFTLGFRGEALSSIGAVSKSRIYTKRKEDTDGVCVTCEGGKIMSAMASGTPNGTIVEVRDLFYNTPARKKFLKKPQVEGGYVGDIIGRYTLSYPQISFKFIRDGKEVIFSSGDNRLKNAVYAVYGKDYATKLIDVDYSADGVRVHGVIGPGTSSRPNRNYESFFVNRRYIKSALICRGVEEAFKNQIMIGKFPMAVLNIEIEPDRVDINVHPTKLECKFSDDELIYKTVYTAVKNALYEIPDVPVIERDTRVEKKLSVENFKTFGGEQTEIPLFARDKKPYAENIIKTEVKNTEKPFTADRIVSEPVRETQTAREVNLEDTPQYFHIISVKPDVKPVEEMNEKEKYKWERKRKRYFKEDGSINSAFVNLYVEKYREISGELQEARILNKPIKLIGYEPEMDIRSDEYKCMIHCAYALAEETGYIVNDNTYTELLNARSAALKENKTFTVNSEDDDRENLFADEDYVVIGQLFGTYILIEKGEKMLIIDQHAAHERLNFEALKEELSKSGVTSQMILMPVEFSLTSEEAQILGDNAELMEKMGFRYTLDGENISVNSLPSGVGWSDGEDLFIELLEAIGSNRQKIIDERKEHMLYSIACKASIKANMNISHVEMEKLAQKVFALDNINTCPHGRPIVISMSKKEIEKDFKRIV